MSKRTFITLFGLCLVTAVAAAEPAPLFPFVLPWDDASPGITDLSGWLPKPAGKFGPVRVGPEGHLYTGGRRLRLNGVDLAFSAAFPTHDQAEKVAARLAKFGNNIVRFHIMDMQRFPNGLLARDAKDTRTFEPEALDRLDYFTAQLIQRGVYIYLCTLNYRPFNAADGLPPEIEQLGAPYQGRHVVGFFNPKEIELQKEYDRAPAAAPQFLHGEDVRRGSGGGDGRDQQRERPAPRVAGRDARPAPGGIPDGTAWAMGRVA